MFSVLCPPGHTDVSGDEMSIFAQNINTAADFTWSYKGFSGINLGQFSISSNSFIIMISCDLSDPIESF